MEKPFCPLKPYPPNPYQTEIRYIRPELGLTLQDIINTLPAEIKLSDVKFNENDDYWYLEYFIKTPMPNFDELQRIYQQRYDRYEKDLTEYIENKKVYDRQVIEQEIEALKTKLEKLQTEYALTGSK